MVSSSCVIAVSVPLWVGVNVWASVTRLAKVLPAATIPGSSTQGLGGIAVQTIGFCPARGGGDSAGIIALCPLGYVTGPQWQFGGMVPTGGNSINVHTLPAMMFGSVTFGVAAVR